jgi:hypothetical protein
METEYYDEYYFQYKNGVMRAWSTILNLMQQSYQFLMEKEKLKDQKVRQLTVI